MGQHRWSSRLWLVISAAALALGGGAVFAQPPPGKGPGPRAGQERREARGEARKTRGEIKKKRVEAREEVREAHREARTVNKEAREAMRRGDVQEARRLRKEAREKVREAHKEAREDLREARTGAAEERLKGDPEAREARHKAGDARRERRRMMRLHAWKMLKKRLGERRSVPAAMRAELKVHARRLARLNRIRRLAVEQKDTAVIERAGKLMAKEMARHRKRMDSLTARLGEAEKTPGAEAEEKAEKKAEKAKEKAEKKAEKAEEKAAKTGGAQ